MKVIKEVNVTKHIFDTTKIGEGDAIVIRDSELQMLKLKYNAIEISDLELGGVKILCLIYEIKDDLITVVNSNGEFYDFYAEEFIEKLDLEILAKQQIYHK